MLQNEERSDLVEFLTGLYDFTDGGPRGRRVFLQQANLSRFLGGMDLTGSSQTFSADLMSRIEDFGYLEPEEPTKHALGALLSYLLTLGDLGSQQKKMLAALIVKYSLIADPVYIEGLRNNYQISQPVVREPAPANTAPGDKKSVASDPSFTVTLPNQEGLESIINSEDNFLDVSWLFGAIYSAHAVCRIEVPEEAARGTGFLIGPDLMLTNHHVLKSNEYVRDAVARFDYRTDTTGVVAKPGRVVKFDPEFYVWSPAEELDYALVRLQERPLLPSEGADLNLPLMDLVLKGWHRGYLVTRPDFLKEHDRVNIIQHPNGDPMKVVMTQNYIAADMSASRVHYVADTMEGSSGSPVFNRKWEVVALHHSGRPYPPDDTGNASKKAWKNRFRVNEGIPIRAILQDFRDRNVERLLPRG
jgi:V8-like Glu-specific endopeptidase